MAARQDCCWCCRPWLARGVFLARPCLALSACVHAANRTDDACAHARAPCMPMHKHKHKLRPAWGNSCSWSQRRHPVITAAKSVREPAGAAQPRTALATERLARPQLYLRRSRHEPCIKVHRFHDPFRLLLLLVVACWQSDEEQISGPGGLD